MNKRDFTDQSFHERVLRRKNFHLFVREKSVSLDTSVSN